MHPWNFHFPTEFQRFPFLLILKSTLCSNFASPRGALAKLYCWLWFGDMHIWTYIAGYHLATCNLGTPHFPKEFQWLSSPYGGSPSAQILWARAVHQPNYVAGCRLATCISGTILLAIIWRHAPLEHCIFPRYFMCFHYYIEGNPKLKNLRARALHQPNYIVGFELEPCTSWIYHFPE